MRDRPISSEQEEALGDLTVQGLASEFREIRDAKLLAYVEGVGTKLAKHLPPIGFKVKLHIIDYPEANAFNIPGGHIFVSRKLVAAATSEDELAGVIAHEMGHAAVHHSATDISEAMRKILKISALGDKKDVADKYNLLIENARTKRVSQRGGHENEQQLEADRIGFFAMVAAGYDPEASFTFFDRITESDGKTGSWFGDIFGKARPAQKRLREMAQATSQLPASCREGRSAKASDDFLRWQADVVMFRDGGRAESLPGLIWKREMNPKLRTDVSHLAFSDDGRFLLVQDDFAVSIVGREKAEVLFQIPAENAENAMFTPDNRYVVFTTEDLRFERWDIEQRKAVEARELVLRTDCWEHALSPNGDFLACVDRATTVKILETKTGKKVWEKKEFYPLSGLELLAWLGQSLRGDQEYDNSFFRIGFSPDSRSVVLSRSNKYRFRISIDGMTVDSSENTALAVDLTTMKPISVGGDIKKLASRPYVFLDAERILGSTSVKLDSGGIFSFPSGKRIQKFEFGAEEIKRTGSGDFATIRPLSNARLGVMDVKQNKIIAGYDRVAAATWGTTIAMESVSGEVVMGQMEVNAAENTVKTKDQKRIQIPASSISGMRAAEVSDDFGWLAMSSKTRGGLWNTSTGSRTVFTRGFDAAVVDSVGNGVADFPKFRSDPHSLAFLNSKNGEANPIRDLPAAGARQYGRFLLTRRSTDSKQKSGDQDELGQLGLTSEQQDESRLRRNVTFELKEWLKDEVVWTRDFTGAAPRYSFDIFSGRLIFYWDLGTDEGKAKLKEDAALKQRADTLGNMTDDYLIEVVDAYEKKTIGRMLLETGKGSFFVGSGQSEGDWLVLNDSEGRVLVYSMGNGELRHRFFGRNASLNPMRQQVAIQNFPGELTIYDLKTGGTVANYEINGKAIFLRYNLKGDRLFVLSDSQFAYSFDLDKASLRKGD